MKQNIKHVGRIARILVGVVILGIGWYYQSWLGLLGLIPILEGLFGWCVLMHFCGKCDTPEKKD